MRVPFSFLTQQFEDPEPIFQRIREFLKRCDFTLGEDLQEFESRYARLTGVKHAVGVGSGTDALALSLRLAGVEPGTEVITAPNSFIATAGAIVQVGARPVFVDIGADLNLEPERVEAAVTARTRALLPVHWAGGPAPLEPLLDIARRHRLPLIEDACQALGARVGDRPVGSLGLAGAFSVHPLKPLHVWGDGGIVVTDDDDLAARLRLLRNHGLANRDEVAVFGVNSRLDNLQAIVGNHVFESLEATLARRIALAERYDRALSGVVELPRRPERGRHVFHLYQIFSPDRDGLLRHLVARGIEAKIHYPVPLHLQPAARSLGYRAGDFPRAERQSTHSLTLPCHQYLTDEQVDYAIEAVKEFHGVR